MARRIGLEPSAIQPGRGEPAGERLRLGPAGLGQLGIGRGVGVLHPHRQPVADQQQLHGPMTLG